MGVGYGEVEVVGGGVGVWEKGWEEELLLEYKMKFKTWKKENPTMSNGMTRKAHLFPERYNSPS